MDNVDTIYQWDTANRKQNDKNKQVYQSAKVLGRKILSIEDKTKEVESFRQALEEGGFIVGATELKKGEFAMHLFNETGDTRLIWDAFSDSEVREAKRIFEEHIKKGHRAYAINSKGKVTRQRIYGFDENSEEIFLDESKTTKEKLTEFIKKFSEIKMVPKTYPG